MADRTCGCWAVRCAKVSAHHLVSQRCCCTSRPGHELVVCIQISTSVKESPISMVEASTEFTRIAYQVTHVSLEVPQQHMNRGSAMRTPFNSRRFQRASIRVRSPRRRVERPDSDEASSAERHMDRPLLETCRGESRPNTALVTVVPLTPRGRSRGGHNATHD